MTVYSSSNFGSDHEEGVTKLRPRKAQLLIPSFPDYAREQQHRYASSSHEHSTEKKQSDAEFGLG
jgi:hypothetical protein